MARRLPDGRKKKPSAVALEAEFDELPAARALALARLDDWAEIEKQYKPNNVPEEVVEEYLKKWKANKRELIVKFKRKKAAEAADEAAAINEAAAAAAAADEADDRSPDRSASASPTAPAPPPPPGPGSVAGRPAPPDSLERRISVCVRTSGGGAASSRSHWCFITSAAESRAAGSTRSRRATRSLASADTSFHGPFCMSRPAPPLWILASSLGHTSSSIQKSAAGRPDGLNGDDPHRSSNRMHPHAHRSTCGPYLRGEAG
jgi:hypothetical protein